MDWGAILYLGVTIGMFVIFAVIVARTYTKSKKDENEAPKYHMLDDD